MKQYFRPLLSSDLARPAQAVSFGHSPFWFDRVEVLSRGSAPQIVSAQDIPQNALAVLSAPRPPIAGLNFNEPVVMGILNVTPDSFSDGGQFLDPLQAVSAAQTMVAQGAHLIDIGGESTRPGSDTVPADIEIQRTQPVIAALKSHIDVPMSLDTRKSQVAVAGVQAGVSIINDVSGFTYDPELMSVCVDHDMPVCVMHAQGDPKTMQDNPTYDDVVLDVYDFLDDQIAKSIAAGIPRERIIADPGIGFGKTLEHNLALLNRIGLFHGLGVPVLLGVSRKGMIKAIAGVEQARDRAPGSMAVALAAWAQGVQIFRVHDVAETKQAFDLWRAVEMGVTYGA